MFSDEERERMGAEFERLEGSPFRGAVAVCSGSDVIERTFGRLADASDTRVASSTFFDLCSVTKTFTAAAVRRLEADQRLALNRRLGEFVERLPDEIARIRIDQLLNHSSGCPDFIDAAGRPCEYSLENDYAPLSRGAFLESVRRSRLLFPSGERWSYSNAGYTLLAAVVEAVSRRGFEEYLRAAVLSPLGMHDTRYTLEPADQARVAAGRRDSRDWRPPNDGTTGPSWNLTGNGGLLSTTTDLVRLRRTFCSPPWSGLEDRPADRRVIVDRSAGIWSGGGRFFRESASGLGPVVYHNGGNSIFSATLRWLPRHDRYVAVLSSSADVTAMAVARTICDRWRGLPEHDLKSLE